MVDVINRDLQTSLREFEEIRDLALADISAVESLADPGDEQEAAKAFSTA